MIRFACGLTAATQSVLSFAHRSWVQHKLRVNDNYDFDNSFLRLLCDEVSAVVTVDPMRNPYINNVDWIHAFMPGRFYVFGSEIGSVQIHAVVFIPGIKGRQGVTKAKA